MVYIQLYPNYVRYSTYSKHHYKVMSNKSQRALNQI